MIGLENAWRSSNRLFARISGQRFKRGIYVFNNTTAISDYHQIGGLLYRAPELAHRIFCFLPLAFLAIDVNGITDGASNRGFIQIRSLQAVRCARFDGCIYRNLIDMIAKENDRGARAFLTNFMQEAQGHTIAGFVITEKEVVGSLVEALESFLRRANAVQPQPSLA